MNIYQHAPILFLLLFGAALASFKGQGKPGRMRKIERGRHKSFKRNPWRGPETKLGTENLVQAIGKEPVNVLDKLKSVKDLKGDIPLKSPYPITTMPRQSDDELALLLAKHESAVDWDLHPRALHPRVLIRSGNETVYKDAKFKDLIFKSRIFQHHFLEIIQEAHDSGNTAFLKAVPYPSQEFPLEEDDAVFFWSFAFGQKWCSREWSSYIDTVEDIDSALRRSEIFNHDNPKVFKHKKVKAFLKSYKIDETLETAIEFDSLSFAQYLKEKHKAKEFKKMIEACSRVHTRGKTFSLYDRRIHNKYDKERLSQVYNFLLENEKEFDASIINFDDAPILIGRYLPLLLDSGFNKVPLTQYDFKLYGSTEAGVKLFKMILSEEYTVGGKAWKEWEEWRSWRGKRVMDTFSTWEEAWSGTLSSIELSVLDSEAFKLISDHLGKIIASKHGVKERLFEQRMGFYQDCMRIAIRKGNIKFVTEAIIPTLKGDGLTFDSLLLDNRPSPADDVFVEAADGNFAVLDWIFDFKPEILESYELYANLDPYSAANLLHRCSPPYVPLLKYLFKRSREKELPPYKYLAKYAQGHLLDAIKDENLDHYNKVRGIDGVTEAMNEHGFKIPEFPVKA